jgi:hypothetical protein
VTIFRKIYKLKKLKYIMKEKIYDSKLLKSPGRVRKLNAWISALILGTITLGAVYINRVVEKNSKIEQEIMGHVDAARECLTEGDTLVATYNLIEGTKIAEKNKREDIYRVLINPLVRGLEGTMYYKEGGLLVQSEVNKPAGTVNSIYEKHDWFKEKE